MLYNRSVILIAGFGWYSRSYNSFGLRPGFRALRFNGISIPITNYVLGSRVFRARRGGILKVIAQVSVG